MAGGDASPCTMQPVTESLMYTNAIRLVIDAGRLISRVRQIPKLFLKTSGLCSVVGPIRRVIPSNKPGATQLYPNFGNRLNFVGMSTTLGRDQEIIELAV